VQLTNQAAYDEIQHVLAALPDEAAREMVLFALVVRRCRQCFRHDPEERFLCCSDRGGAR
jgi:hypothetical protein